MKKIRILSIAPYEDLQNLVSMAAAEFPEIQLDLFTGNLERAIEYVAAFPRQKFDAIISRGGTADFLRKYVDIPVVEIEISVLDMLRALKLAESCGEPFAVVGYSNIVHTASRLCDILQFERPCIREVTASHVRQQVEELRDQGIRLILGDVVAVQAAEEADLLSILITSSKASVAAAFEAAITLCKTIARDQTFFKLYQDIVESIPAGVIVFDRSGRHIQSNHLARMMDQEKLFPMLQKYIPILQEQGEMHLYRQCSNQLLEITGQMLQANGSQYSCFFVRMSYKTSSVVPGVTIGHPDDPAKNRYLLLAALKSQPVLKQIEQAIQGSSAAAIIGDPGMGKTSLAHYMHNRSSRRNGLFLHVACNVLQERHWTRFISNINSPINGKGCTVFFENIHRLAPSIQELLSTYIDDTLLGKRNHIICSSVVDLQELVVQERFSLPLYRQLCQITIPLPRLRERQEVIPVLATTLINQLNIEHNKSVGGLQPEALAMLQAHAWPLNLTQFEKTLSDLVRDSSSYLITAEETASALYRYLPASPEDIQAPTADDPQGQRFYRVDMRQSLDEIEQSIIHQVLAQEGMNQSAAAKRLGISRSTLWRKLK